MPVLSVWIEHCDAVDSINNSCFGRPHFEFCPRQNHQAISLTGKALDFSSESNRFDSRPIEIFQTSGEYRFSAFKERAVAYFQINMGVYSPFIITVNLIRNCMPKLWTL